MDNFENSPWSDRLFCFHAALDEFVEEPEDEYDLIVSNPPYFQNSLNAPDEQRSKARHNKELELIEIITGASKLLSDTGILSIILPYIEGVLFITKAAENGLYCVRQTNVLPKPKTPTKRLLLEFQKTKKTVVDQDLVIESGSRHEYSENYKEITRDFYLFL